MLRLLTRNAPRIQSTLWSTRCAPIARHVSQMNDSKVNVTYSGLITIVPSSYGSYYGSYDYIYEIINKYPSIINPNNKSELTVRELFDAADKLPYDERHSSYKIGYLQKDKKYSQIVNNYANNSPHKTQILHDIKNLMRFVSYDVLDVFPLMQKYNLSAFDIFRALLDRSQKFNLGNFDRTQVNYDEMKKYFDAQKKAGEKTISFDYHRGFAIKNTFYLDPTDHFYLYTRKYDDRNTYPIVEQMVKLICKSQK